MRVSHRSFWFLAVLALAACGGAETAATTPKAVPPLTGPFGSGTKDQQLNHMRTVIQPTMGALFKTFDGKKYGEFGCVTCHGEKKEDPHKVLPRLTFSGGGFKKVDAEKPTEPAVMKFMIEQVTPTMAKSMNERPFDPATQKGFGCGGCHKVE